MKSRTETPQDAQKGLSRAGRESLLFDALRDGDDETFSTSRLVAALRESGLAPDDPRVADTLALLAESGPTLDLAAFRRAIDPSLSIIERALRGELVIRDFRSFSDALREIFGRSGRARSGAAAHGIPRLGRTDAERFGAAVVSIDGQCFSVGDASSEFCVQSTCNPISYCLALEEQGVEGVHRHIGCEPSGVSCNEIALNARGLPHNPMIDAGAIMSGALIRPGLRMQERFDHVLGTWRDLAGRVQPGFSQETFHAELSTANRGFALGYFMRERGVFPEGTELAPTLEFFRRSCAIEMTVESMAMVAATLANGGVCPRTGERVLQSSTVQKCLKMMDSCGMYDASGEWALHVGLPAKSGASGVILAVVPNVAGFCAWSPPLDTRGKSICGVKFFRGLAARFDFHDHDGPTGSEGRTDPRRRPRDAARGLAADLCWAASEGDLEGLRRLSAQGISLDAADYDGRTPLHLAASEGHLQAVTFFADRGARLDPRDRWGNAPLDDAVREGHADVEAMLRERIGTAESPQSACERTAFQGREKAC